MKKELLFTFSALIATTSCNIKKTDSEQIAGKKPMRPTGKRGSTFHQ